MRKTLVVANYTRSTASTATMKTHTRQSPASTMVSVHTHPTSKYQSQESCWDVIFAILHLG